MRLYQQPKALTWDLKCANSRHHQSQTSSETVSSCRMLKYSLDSSDPRMKLISPQKSPCHPFNCCLCRNLKCLRCAKPHLLADGIARDWIARKTSSLQKARSQEQSISVGQCLSLRVYLEPVQMSFFWRQNFTTTLALQLAWSCEDCSDRIWDFAEILSRIWFPHGLRTVRATTSLSWLLWPGHRSCSCSLWWNDCSS